MSKVKPIEQARNPDLRGSLPAMLRAAQRARELAIQTGTELVVSRDGVVERIDPRTLEPSVVQEPAPAYPDAP